MCLKIQNLLNLYLICRNNSYKHLPTSSLCLLLLYMFLCCVFGDLIEKIHMDIHIFHNCEKVHEVIYIAAPVS